MASNNKKTEPAHDAQGVKLEVAGILLLALSLYSAVSLFSYPGAKNWGGVLGQLLSWALLRSIGYISYALPLVLIIISAGFLLRRIFRFRAAVP